MKSNMCTYAISRCRAYSASSSTAEELVSKVIQEIVTITQALIYDSITSQVVNEQRKRAQDRKGDKGIEPSMLVDVLTAQRMEVEAIIGNPMSIATGKGINVPRPRALYAINKALDDAIALRQPEKSLAGAESREVRQAPLPV